MAYTISISLNTSALTLGPHALLHLRALLYRGTQLQETTMVDWPAGASLAVPSASDKQTYTGSPLLLHDADLHTLVLGPLDNQFTSVRRPSRTLGGALACGS